MSCLKFENIGIEESLGEGQENVRKPLFVVSGRVRPNDDVAGRVAEVLDLELAQGSMPA
jgi:hypothetical protein